MHVLFLAIASPDHYYQMVLSKSLALHILQVDWDDEAGSSSYCGT